MHPVFKQDYCRDVLLNVVVSLGLTAVTTFVIAYFMLFGD
jgi:hypothetical protein